MVGGDDDAAHVGRDDALRGGFQQDAQFAIVLRFATRLQLFLEASRSVTVEFEAR
jgi:hypothetical protein